MIVNTLKSFIVFLAFNQWLNVNSLNILGVFPYYARSHFNVFAPYLRELAEKGHNLTVISHFPLDKPIKNYHDISLAGNSMTLQSAMPIMQSSTVISFITAFAIAYMCIDSCRNMLEDEEVQDLWLSEKKFDVVVAEQFVGDCALGLAHKLNAPVVGLTSHVLMLQHYNRFGITFNPSYTRGIFLEVTNEPSLYERIEHTVFYHFFNFLNNQIIHRFEHQALTEYFTDLPSLEELSRKMKFLLLYSNFVVTGSNIFPSNVIEVGGYHVAKTKPLPDNLLKFIQESKHGVIYISFGSIFRGSSLPKEKLKIILDALAELPQRVIWKWESKAIPGKPKNIMVSKWLPQNDLLAHPNVIAFFSHCGNLGTTEAIYHGVPIIGMPLQGDQSANAVAIEKSGFGVKILFRELTKENLDQKLKKVLDPKFRANVKLLSRAWHDRPASAMASAVHWTEFAAKYPNFTFTPAAAEVPLYQYLSLDIILILIVAPISIFSILVLVSLKCYFKRKFKTIREEKKHN